MVRTGGENFWRGLTCHMAILALPSGVFSTRMGRCRSGILTPGGAWGHYGRASAPGGQSAEWRRDWRYTKVVHTRMSSSSIDDVNNGAGQGGDSFDCSITLLVSSLTEAC